jgi:hypothetical protein
MRGPRPRVDRCGARSSPPRARDARRVAGVTSARASGTILEGNAPRHAHLLRRPRPRRPRARRVRPRRARGRPPRGGAHERRGGRRGDRVVALPHGAPRGGRAGDRRGADAARAPAGARPARGLLRPGLLGAPGRRGAAAGGGSPHALRGPGAAPRRAGDGGVHLRPGGGGRAGAGDGAQPPGGTGHDGLARRDGDAAGGGWAARGGGDGEPRRVPRRPRPPGRLHPHARVGDPVEPVRRRASATPTAVRGG